MRYSFLLSILFMCLLFTGIARAQISAGPDPLEYTVAPESPGPNQPVVITIRGIGSFLGESTITWQQDGKTTDSGVGHSTYSFSTGGVGTQTHIRVNVSTPGGRFSRDFYFAPSVVNMLWEANTSVPTFYQGKSLYSPGSTLKVVAIPLIASGSGLVATNKLSFQWSRGGNPVPSASGTGRNTFTFTGDQIQSEERVGVNVYSGSTVVGRGDITIPATTPSVILYSRDPLRGTLLDTALPRSFNLLANEITLDAQPYFFSNESLRAGKISFSWLLNNTETSGPDTARGLLTLRQTGQGSGSAMVQVNIQNTEGDKLIQGAQQSLQFSFGSSVGATLTSFFGL